MVAGLPHCSGGKQVSALLETIAESFQPITAVNRIADMELPEAIPIGGKLIPTPKCLSAKSAHYTYAADGSVRRELWIHKGMGHLLNAYRFDGEVRKAELSKCLQEIRGCISRLVKEGALSDRRGPGAMSFAQSNENVPEGSLMISKRSYGALCQAHKKWKDVSDVVAVRFPNLGPGTTQRLKLIVNSNTKDYDRDSLYYRVPELRSLLSELEDESETVVGTIDCFYLHPIVLKDGMEGDGDGDTIYLLAGRPGKPSFQEIDLTREPAPIEEEEIETLFRKCDRLSRENLHTFLPPYFDNTMISSATYAIRWRLFNTLKQFSSSPHPMNAAWEHISQDAIKLIEFVMDMRKADHTEEEVTRVSEYLNRQVQEITEAKKNGHWFAKTVLSSEVVDPGQFIQRFETLSQFIRYVTHSQKEALDLTALE